MSLAKDKEENRTSIFTHDASIIGQMTIADWLSSSCACAQNLIILLYQEQSLPALSIWDLVRIPALSPLIESSHHRTRNRFHSPAKANLGTLYVRHQKYTDNFLVQFANQILSIFEFETPHLESNRRQIAARRWTIKTVRSESIKSM